MTRYWPYGVLLLLGAGWGLTIPLTKIVVSTGHLQFGLIFWQLAIMSVVLAGIQKLRKRHLKFGQGSIKLFLIVALLGTVLPNFASYAAARHLPASIMALLIATVPMWSFPIAISLGMDRFSVRRMGGLIMGLLAVGILVSPDTSHLDKSVLWFVPVALVAPFFYGIEGNYIAKFGTLSHGPIETLLGASLCGLIVVAPLAFVTGHMINPFTNFGTPEIALIFNSILHALVYATYVWLVGRVGSVFASQVSYAVTLFGVVWSILFLGETTSPFLWAALLCMMAGMILVQPKHKGE